MDKRNTVNGGFSRRDFLKTSAAASAAVIAATAPKAYAAGSETLKIALIGCGGRGNGAVGNCKKAAEMLGMKVQVVACADPQADRAKSFGAGNNVPQEMIFTGFDGYRKVCASDAEYVILATSPNFRPLHLEACVKAGKHVFMEKPVAVDPQGIRRVIAAGELAKKKGLGIVAGTQRRHQKSYLECASKVQQGAIGRIMSAKIWWCGNVPWIKQQSPGESDALYLAKNWLNIFEMSGDHITEQHVHNIDVANWYIGRPPVQCLGFGGRARRITGNSFDFFSIDFDYGDDVMVQSMCRQVASCYNRVAEYFVGTNGNTWGGGNPKMINNVDCKVPEFKDGNPYDIEHYDNLVGIREGKPLNEAKQVAESTMGAIMGRMSAYTGQLIRWSDVMTNEKSPFYNYKCTPAAEDFENGGVVKPVENDYPVPGKPDQRFMNIPGYRQT